MRVSPTSDGLWARGPNRLRAVDIATLATPIRRAAEKDDPNVVKAVGTEVSPGRLRALYFTRATAPHGDGPRYHHIGLYAYRRAALERFVALPPSPLEQQEKLEQLRALEAGMRIDITIVDTMPRGVDTLEIGQDVRGFRQERPGDRYGRMASPCLHLAV